MPGVNQQFTQPKLFLIEKLGLVIRLPEKQKKGQGKVKTNKKFSNLVQH